ncbi:MAG: PilZ domain-containing protein [Rhodospirillaceae bacterium]|nr:PilZ domain-containing protein [Rhodospirillaceae bacterium]MBL6929975.1 PilZ domain-containing protein [Rhodospirillales bacterium]MBL6940752.1 PilZ domain-containing protein [Rhodospirillales bacterium]
MSDDHIEKRRYPRHELHKSVRIEIDGEVVVGETSDISQGGVSIHAENHLSNDAFVHMHIETIGEMTGHVVRTSNDSFAVRFDPVEEERLRLAKHLKSMFEKD